MKVFILDPPPNIDAPHAGARIEIVYAWKFFFEFCWTPPTRGRELKSRLGIYYALPLGRPPRGGEN